MLTLTWVTDVEDLSFFLKNSIVQISFF